MEEIICRKCGASCSDAYKFCPNCGASLDSDKCPQCGAELIDGAKFCVSCGARVVEEPIDTAADQGDEAVATDEDTKTDTVSDEHDTAEETEEQAVAVKSVSAPKSKSKKVRSATANYIVRIVKNASVFVLCAILFALSFCNIIKTNVDAYFDFQLEGCEVNLSAVDVMEIMFSTADLSGDEERYSDELEELNVNLRESLQKDYNERLDKYFLSNKTKALLHDVMVCTQKDMLAAAQSEGSALYNNVIISGVFCFLNILFTAAMLVVSSISLLFVVLKKRNKVAKYLYAMPVYLFVTLIILFLVKTTLGTGAVVAGAMGATLFFELLAIITTVVLIFSAKKKKVIKNAIPKLVSVAASIIVCACLFAPVFTADYELILKNRTHPNTYSISVDAAGMITYLPPSEVESLPSSLNVDEYAQYRSRIESILKNTSYLTASEFKEGGETLTRMIMMMVVYMAGNYSAIGALSAGYYVLMIVFMLFGAFAVWSIASLFRKDNSIYCLFIPILILIATALGCSIGWICIMNYHLEDLACSFTVGGGLISAIVLSVLTLVFVGIFSAVANKEKRVKAPDELTLDYHDAESIA